MQVVMEYLIYSFMLFFFACTMLRILIQLWGLCIFLYCYYYGHDNNITDMIVFSLINASKKGQNTRMLVKTGLC